MCYVHVYAVHNNDLKLMENAIPVVTDRLVSTLVERTYKHYIQFVNRKNTCNYHMS